MPEPLRSLSRTRWARWSLWVFALALLSLGTARVPLEDAPRVEALASELAARLGAEVRFGAVRVDPLGAGGVVVTDLQVDGGGWHLSVPRAVWRPRVSALLRGGPRLVLSGRSFRVDLDGRLSDLLLPDIDVDLTGGRLFAGPFASPPGGSPPGSPTALLESVRLVTRGEGAARHFALEGHQPGGGRLDVRVRRESGGLVADLFPEALALTTLSAALPQQLVEIGDSPLAAEGHWRVRLEPDGARSHSFDLALRSEAGRQIDLRARGELVTRGVDHALRLLAGSRMWLGGRMRHDGPGIHVSGPVEASVELEGPLTDPLRRLHVDLGAAHLRVGEHLRKPVGLAARLVVEREPRDEGPARTRIAVDLGEARVELAREGSGPFVGGSDWVSLADLGGWLPGLGEAASGRVRLAGLRYADRDDYEARIDLQAVQALDLGGPLALTGQARWTPEGFSARGLSARVADIGLRVDLSGQRGAPGEPLEIDISARAEALAFDAGAVTAGAPGADGPRPQPRMRALMAVAEAPVRLLHEARTRLAGFSIRSGHLAVERLRVGDQLLRNLEIDIALRSLRLEVPLVSFQGAAGEERYSGVVDFNPLLPAVAFAEVP